MVVPHFFEVRNLFIFSETYRFLKRGFQAMRIPLVLLLSRIRTKNHNMVSIRSFCWVCKKATNRCIISAFALPNRQFYFLDVAVPEKGHLATNCFSYPTSTRRHGNFAGVHTLLWILLSRVSSNSAVLINIITGVSPPHFDFVVYYVLCQC
jgi:hypothetical protein